MLCRAGEVSFCEGFCELSNILGDVGVVFSEVQNGVDVNPERLV